MGEVYLVQHPRLPRQDALKVLRPDVSDDPSFRERFIREADLAAALRHPHIVGIHDRGEHDGQLWIAMDYIEGTDTGELVQKRYPAGMPAELAIPIITAVASALDYAHKKGLLHRDVKPANIIVTDLESDDRHVFLADFGIARSLDDISGITTTNMTVGTVAYAAPEQLMGEEMDGRADQYALAATTYHLLTGSKLFPHSNPAVVISRHLNTTPPALRDRRPDCAGIDDVLQVGLAKNPDDRFSSCSAFAQALADEFLPGASAANATTQEAPQSRGSGQRSTPTPAAEPSATGSRRLWVIVGSVAAVMLLVGAVVLVWRPWDSRQTHSDGTTSTGAVTSAHPPPPTAAPPQPPQLPRVSHAKEENFVAALRAAPGASWQHISWAMIPGGGADTRNDDALLLKHGYEACDVMDQHPAANRQDVAYTFYSEQGFNMESIASFPQYYQEMTAYMDYAARYLCPRNSAASPEPTTTAAPVQTGPTIGDECNDWMKFATDSKTGEEMLCFGYPDTLSRGEPMTWFSTTTGPVAGAADKPLVGRTGSPCSAPPYTFGRSSDGYSVWCVGDGAQSDQNPVWKPYAP
jgi:serine/threonine-protein kinase